MGLWSRVSGLRVGRPRWAIIARRWALLGAAVAIVAAWLVPQFDLGAAANWFDVRERREAARTWPPGQHGAALLVRSGEEVLQLLPEVGVEILRGQTITYGAHIWGDTAARGRLIVVTGDQRQELPFEVSGSHDLMMQAVVPKQAPDVSFSLVADSGEFYADDLWASGEKLHGNLIANGGLELPAVWFGTPLSMALRYLRLHNIIWIVQSGRLAQPLPYGDVWLDVLFDTFWGYFGWLKQPYVSGSLWKPLLAACCALGALGTLRWLLWRQGQPRQRRLVLALLLLIAASLVILVINA